jgi:hypothetical protein
MWTIDDAIQRALEIAGLSQEYDKSIDVPKECNVDLEQEVAQISYNSEDYLWASM